MSGIMDDYAAEFDKMIGLYHKLRLKDPNHHLLTLGIASSDGNLERLTEQFEEKYPLKPGEGPIHAYAAYNFDLLIAIEH